jgi:hypothetical protein
MTVVRMNSISIKSNYLISLSICFMSCNSTVISTMLLLSNYLPKHSFLRGYRLGRKYVICLFLWISIILSNKIINFNKCYRNSCMLIWINRRIHWLIMKSLLISILNSLDWFYNYLRNSNIVMTLYSFKF